MTASADGTRPTLRSGFVALLGWTNVGKSTLLNRLVGVKLAAVAEVAQTTRNRIEGVRNIANRGQIVLVDTPGIRQFQLWDVIPEEVAGFYRDLRPFVSLCRYPDCSHIHETDCAVKEAVAEGSAGRSRNVRSSSFQREERTRVQHRHEGHGALGRLMVSGHRFTDQWGSVLRSVR